MKPAVFDYYNPESLKESLVLLDKYGFDAKILSGGQSLVPMMNMRLARPEILIDINNIEELNYIRLKEDEMIIGGLTRHCQIENSEEVKNACPLLTEGIKLIGHSQIRSRGTIGGSIVHADPTAELPVILTTLNGTVTLASNEGERTLSTDEFFLTYLTTTIEPNEILVSVQIPLPKPRSGQAIEEFTLRSGDFAIVLASAAVTLDASGQVEEARLVLGGVDGIPVVLDEVTDQLIGKTADDDLIKDAANIIEDLIDPEPDIHATAEYRKDLSKTLSRRVLERAIRRASKV
ncbi:FAD binding domain-containing protein [Scopulibacillus cellulosilyticus]|uniref:FAD binding domain-containing protein n=1 Tax=Scopulibacillus cellulosilyticus TaxID=2665665 RepID=A0ABW2PW06_9BACL